MKGPLVNPENRSMDFEALPIHAVALSQWHIDQAVAISDRVVTETRQWQTYLNALGLFGLQEWFAEQVPDLVLDWQHCSLFQPQYANLIEAAYDVRINHDFKLCLISIGGTIEPWIKLPRAVVDLAEFRAHLYVIVQVMEEQSQVQVLSFLRYDQWLTHCQAQPLRAETDWSYQVPIQWFDANPHRLLRDLQCLDSATLALENAPPDTARGTLQQDLVRRLAQAESVETPLWQLLPWKEGTKVLTHPALVNWLYEVQTGRISLAPKPQEVSTLIQPVLNAGAWLRNELDAVAQSLGWMLLPPLAELRSLPSPPLTPTQDGPALPSAMTVLERIRRQLSRDGIALPAEARCIYQTLTLAETPLELYAMAWLVQDEGGQPVEWALLLVLKTVSAEAPRPALTLSVKDQTRLLVEHPLPAEGDRNSIYAQVAGTWDEVFQVTLTTGTGAVLCLPPFTFPRGELV